jgi:adenylate kinase
MATNLILVGAPGSGKGTQSKLLLERHQLPQISTGDILRAAVKAGTPLGKKAQEYMNAGKLVPDELIMGLIEERLGQPELSKGFVLDGFPRTLNQAKALSALLEKLGQTITKVVVIDVDEQVIFERIVGRRTCTSCGNVHHVKFSPPKKDGVCDRCGSPLVQRPDDSEEKARVRLQEFREVKAQVIPYYEGQGLVARVDGEASPEKVYAAIENSFSIGDTASNLVAKRVH